MPPNEGSSLKLHVDRAEPRIVARNEVGRFYRLARRAVELHLVVVDPPRHRVADDVLPTDEGAP